MVIGLCVASAWGKDASLSASESSEAAREKLLKPILSLQITESYDSNVYLQQITERANQDSFVTTITPTIGFNWEDEEKLNNVKLTYAPSISFYHAEPEEDHTWHQTDLCAKFQISEHWKVDVADKIIWVQGSEHHNPYPGMGNAPSMNIATRDRHAQFVQWGKYAFTFLQDEWLARFVTENYLHDFQMEQRDPAASPGYQNFADRKDINGGFDIGYKAVEELYPLLGFRYGHKDQTRIFANETRYCYDYQRLLFGIEGKAGSWLTCSIQFGPEWEQFESMAAQGFDRQHVAMFVDATAQIKPTDSDTIKLAYKRYTQPGAGGRSVYEQLIASGYYRHDFGEAWSGWFIEPGCLVYYGDWYPMTSERNDWMMRPTLTTGLTLAPNTTWQISYFLEKSLTGTNGMPSREYDRHVISTSIKYVF